MKSESTIYSIKVLNELIDNASTLPVECQDWLLVLAKGMAYTRKCIEQQGLDTYKNQNLSVQPIA